MISAAQGGAVFSAAVAAILLSIEPAHATVFPAMGGRGDRAEEYLCPTGEVLIGFRGRTGSWIDQIGLLCAAPGADYSIGPSNALPPRGGNGGSPTEQYCAPDSAIRRIETRFMAGTVGGIKSMDRAKYVLSITFECLRPIDGSDAGGNVFGGTGFGSDLWPVGPVENGCENDEYATGLNIRYGKYVNAAGLICDPFRAPDARKPQGTFIAAVPTTKMEYAAKTDAITRSVTASAVGAGTIAKVVVPPSSTASPATSSAPPAAAPTSSTTGIFDTSFGVLEIRADAGTYTVSDGHVSVQSTHDNIIEGVWEQSSAAKQCPDGRYWGKFVFAFSAKGFTGFYGFCDDAPTAGEWNGTRR
jgi:hypothetical protein